MIDIALILLRDELRTYITLSKHDNSVVVNIDNIALLEPTGHSSLSDSIIISLVNIEEESTLKNQSAVKRPFINNAVYQNPPVYLNLYVLFTSNYSGNNYSLALKRLSYIIQFVQSKNSFSIASSVSAESLIENNPDVLDLKFTLELYTLTFEQINHLWGSLGGRQVPFAMYKLRLVAISDHATIREVPLIEEIETSTVIKN